MYLLAHVRRHSLAAALVCTLVVEAVAAVRGQYEVPLGQFLLGAQELGSVHRITSTFLPIGYPVVLAAAFASGNSHGEAGRQAAFFIMNILLSYLMLLLIRGLLTRATSPTFASLAALLITLQPELVHNLTKVSDTNLTAVLLLWVVWALIRLHEGRTGRNALHVGVAIGCAALVRPNMALLGLLVLWAVWKAPLRDVLRLGASTLAPAACLYLMVTAAVHGRPFFPQNGPYNSFAGANRYTAQQLYVHLNAETSVLPALADLGIHTRMDWNVPSDQPGLDDARDLHYAPLYRREARRFAGEHPVRMGALSVVKLFNFLRPETNRYHFDDPFNLRAVPWLALKVCSALVVPGWFAVLIWQRRRGLHLANTLVILASAIYTLPFVLINSDPRFRVPLSVLLLADAARIFHGIREAIKPSGTKAYLTSAPRPAV